MVVEALTRSEPLNSDAADRAQVVFGTLRLLFKQNGQSVEPLPEAFGRAAEPWEVAATIAFLASDYSSYLTGEVISVSSQRA